MRLNSIRHVYQGFYVEGNGQKFDLNAVSILRESSEGLADLHSLRIIHRDLKPQNILISFPIGPLKQRKILISDFEKSKLIAPEEEGASSNGNLGAKVKI